MRISSHDVRLHFPKPRGWLDWVLAIGCLVLIGLALSSIGGSSSGSAATKRTTTVARGVVQSTVSGNGNLEPAEKAELDFGASGEVTAIYVKAGERVSKGEVLARVDSSAARASLASAKAQLSEAEEALESSEEAEETEEVSYDSTDASVVLVAYEATDVTAAETEEEAAVKAAEEERAAAEEKQAEAEKEQKQAEAETEAEKRQQEQAGGGGSGTAEEVAASPSGESGESAGGGSAESGSATSTQSVESAEANLREAQLSVKSARQEVRETTLRAPIAGTVASVSGAVGETVSAGSSSSSGTSATAEGESASAEGESASSGSSSAFMVVAQLQRLTMEVSFSESDIGKVEVGQTATVAISSMEGTELAGRVIKVGVLPSEGSSEVVEYSATILLSQSAKGLRSGMSANAEVVVEEVKNAITVSSEAIVSGQSKTVTVEEDGKEVDRTVTTGLAGDETTQIVSGLKVGETVVLPEATVAAASGGGEGESDAEAGGFPAGGLSGTPPSGGSFPGGS